MENVLITWLLDLIREFAKFGTFLTQDLPYIGISPLSLFSFTGLTILIGFLLYRLVIGG